MKDSLMVGHEFVPREVFCSNQIAPVSKVDQSENCGHLFTAYLFVRLTSDVDIDLFWPGDHAALHL